MTMVEEWKEINTSPGYWISNFGRVKNKKDDILSPYVINSGYYCIKIGSDRNPYLIHRLVALHFVVNPDALTKTQVNHKDGNKLNNIWTNLEWVSQSENMQHASANNLLKPKKGISSPFAKHTECQIRKACEMLQAGNFKIVEISLLTGVSIHTLEGIKHGTKWKDISSQYNIPKPHIEKWSDDMYDIIRQGHDQGLSSRGICEMLQIPYTNANSLRINRFIRKDTRSTTIDQLSTPRNTDTMSQ